MVVAASSSRLGAVMTSPNRLPSPQMREQRTDPDADFDPHRFEDSPIVTENMDAD